MLNRDDIKNSNLLRFFDHWDRLRGDRIMPMRKELDLEKLPRDLLPHLVLFEARDEPIRIFVRLCGTMVCEYFGEDPTGRYVDDVDMGDVTQKTLDRYYRMIEDKQPDYGAAIYVKQDGRILSLESLAVPFSLDGESVSQMLSCVFYKATDADGIPIPISPLIVGHE